MEDVYFSSAFHRFLILTHHCKVRFRFGALAVLSTKSVDVELNFLELRRLSRDEGSSARACPEVSRKMKRLVRIYSFIYISI